MKVKQWSRDNLNLLFFIENLVIFNILIKINLKFLDQDSNKLNFLKLNKLSVLLN